MSNFYKSLNYRYFPTSCSFGGQETLGEVAYRAIDCLTGFSARKMLENSGFSAAIVFVKKTVVC
jgi:hypothetical protein